MGKNKEQFKSANPEEAIVEKKNELDNLQRELAGLDKKGKKVDILVNRIQVLIFEVSNDRGDIQRFKKDPPRFASKLLKVSKEIVKIKNAIEDLKTEPPELEKVKEKQDEDTEDVKKLEAEAALEDLEFKKWEEKYVDAKYNLEEFLDYIKKHKLEKGREEAAKDLKARLAELHNLLKNKNYENFKDKHDEFDDILENLYPPTPIVEEKMEPATATAGTKENKSVAKKTAEEQKIAQERGKALHKKNQERFNELVRSIKLVDAKKNQKGKFFNSFQKQLDILYISLQNDAELDDPKEFATNVKLFNDTYKQAEERVEKERAAEEEPETKAKPAEPETADATYETASRIKKPRLAPSTPAAPEIAIAPPTPAEATKSPERKRRILDISEKDLLEIVGERKLREVVNEIILGNADVAVVLMKDIFSRKDIDLKDLNSVVEKFGYTPIQFMKEWAETLHVRAFEVTKQWVEQMTRNWLNKNIKLWDRIKENPMAHAKLMAVNILPFAALAGSIGVFATTGGATHVARGAIVGGATGLLRGLKAKVGSVRGWFEKRKENAREQIAAGVTKIKEKKALPLRDSMLAQFTGENGPEMMEQLSAMLSQSLRDASAANVQKDAVEKLKSGVVVAVEEISKKIDVEFEAMKKSAGEETAKEVQRNQTERAETLIKKLYEDKDLEELIQKVIDRDPKIVGKLQGLKINGIEFGKFINEDDKDPVKKESNARKVVSVLASGVAGASIGGAIAAAPELRAVLGAVAGGYLGVKYGHLKDRHAREAQFEKEFTGSIAKAEKVIEEWETRQIKKSFLESTPENIKELAERAKDLRAPLTLGMMEGDINLKLRAQNALRRLESLQINLYINQNPGVEERAIPEAQRNSGVERLLTGLNSELEELTKHQQNIEQRILQKPGWWRVVGYGVAGAVAGAGLGYGTAKLQEYTRGQHKQPTVVSESEQAAVVPVEHASASEHVAQKDVVAPVPEASVTTEPLKHGDHTVAVEVLNNREGILHGVNKIIHNNPDIFTYENGKPWTASEIHLWKVNELKEMGFKFEGGKWGYPMTMHAGAQVEVYTDEQGQPHFKLASEEHVTFNKNYKWVDTERHPAEAGAIDSVSKDELINPYPESHAIKADVESAVDHAQIAKAGIIERAAMPKSAKVDLDIKDKAIVHHAPAAALEAAEVKETASQFLTERGSNPKEFITVYDKMVDATVDRLNNSFIFRGGAGDFLQNKISALYHKTGMTGENIASVNPSDSGSLAMMEKVLDAETKFKFNQPDWLKTFSQTMFDKSDKAIRLALAPDRDVLLEPIKTNGGHAARIWDPAEEKDVFIYDKNRVFNTNEDGRLIVEDKNGIEKLYTQKKALQMSEKELF